MKKHLLLLVMATALLATAHGQMREWAYNAGALANLSEVNGGNALSAGMMAGVSSQRIHLGVYGLRTVRPAQSETYEARLEEYGLYGNYLFAITPRLNLYLGARAGTGQADMEAIHNGISEGTQEEVVRTFSPEVGIEIPLGRHLSLAYTSGYRWVWGATEIEDVGCGTYSSLYTGLAVRLGFFPGR